MSLGRMLLCGSSIRGWWIMEIETVLVWIWAMFVAHRDLEEVRV